ncbi:serine/threonine-protein kinase MAK isoform X8 [Sardina pilchardus]|uniref:serine/threonine-protein kinase MAK isoform X8 n=1 Tax=Sardina pilchardus TaxID=27697 RepID=UPI002E158281
MVTSGLAFVHKHGFFHRDMKPENLLCMGPELVKIADFGLAREIRSRPPYTDYVSTRWYRAPEVLLRSSVYSSPIDMWAVGCIMAELYTLRPLFPGNSEVDEIFKICQVLGTVKKSDWPEGYQLASAMNFRFPQCVPTPLKTLIPNASNEAISLMRDMLMWDPKKRPTAAQALRYPYFQVGQLLGPRPLSSDLRKSQAKSSQAPDPKLDIQSASEPVLRSSTKLSGRNSTQPLQPLPQNVPQTEHHSDPIKQERPHGLPKKSSLPGSENTVVGVKGGRRRWGQTMSKPSDSWDDSDRSDTAVSSSKKPSIGPEEEKANKDSSAQAKEQKALYSFSTVTKLPSNIKVNQTDLGVQNSTSARQHYLRQSRYLPGLMSKNTSSLGDKGTSKDPLDGTTNSMNKPLAPIVGGSSITRVNAGNFISTTYNLSGGYIPSFQKREVGSVGQRIQLAPIGGQHALDLSTVPDSKTGKTKPSKPKPISSASLTETNEDYEGWKKRMERSQLKGSSYSALGKNSGNLLTRAQPVQPVHGRVDWAAKYGTHR